LAAAGSVGGHGAELVDSPAPPPPPELEAPRPEPCTARAALRGPRAPLQAAAGPSYILQHYHATGCAGGAFSWRAAGLNPEKALYMCTAPRDYRETTAEDIALSKADKRFGGGPRVGPFQEQIPGQSWEALPKYDFTSRNRSSAFNERMHVEWENHADHILKNGGELPPASVVAKAGFRSCAPCCRDMLALARPTGKTFIMVDLAEDDTRGTFHFVTGGQYLPVPKEACNSGQVAALKRVVADAQDNLYASSEEIFDKVASLGVPIDKAAQALYTNDQALLPVGCARNLKGDALLEALHAEHFARLTAEYGASILRDPARPTAQRQAVMRCRAKAAHMLLAAWAPHLAGVRVDLQAYVDAAITPLLPDSPSDYQQLRRAVRAPRPSIAALTAEHLLSIREDLASPAEPRETASRWRKRREDDGALSTVSTATPDDAASRWSDSDGYPGADEVEA